ncbi:MAG: hypothetical protein GY754_23395 [bacterium]|nr:hypothetical protein [bacterium]
MDPQYTAPDDKTRDDKEEFLTRKEKVEDGEDPNDFELMKDYGVDKDESTLTDEDIFEKIISEESQTPGDESAYEIIGDQRSEDGDYDLSSSADNRKRQDEEDFYKKFLRSNKMKRKELPILKVSFDFTKLPDEFSLSREKNVLEYSFYKYKPMLEKAQELLKRKKVRDAINYYKVVMGQNIPPEFKGMIRKNIDDLTEYLEKYLASD